MSARSSSIGSFLGLAAVFGVACEVSNRETTSSQATGIDPSPSGESTTGADPSTGDGDDPSASTGGAGDPTSSGSPKLDVGAGDAETTGVCAGDSCEAMGSTAVTPQTFEDVLRDTLAQVIIDTCSEIEPPA